MKRNVMKTFFVLFFIILSSRPVFAGEVNCSVAASLKEVLIELDSQFVKQNPDVHFQNNFASSGALAKQIDAGAPADLFISANLEWVDFLKEKKLIDENYRSILAYNVLVFVGKPELKVKNLKDVTTLDKIAIGSPKSVPCGEYALQALKSLGLDTQLENKLVMAKDVRECLVYAERGEVNGAFVYKTDAEELAKNVLILFTVPQDLYPRVTYPMALTVTGSKNPEVVDFFKFLQSAEAKAILQKHGFIVQ